MCSNFKTSSVPFMPTRNYAKWHLCNNPVSKSRGMAIGFYTLLLVSDVQEVNDLGGRFLILKCKMNNTLFTLVNVYASNQGQIPMMLTLSCKLGSLIEGRVVLGGELNIILDPTLDTTSTLQRCSLPQLNHLKRQLVDVWQVLHPIERDYTCHSKTHETYSRIDLFLVSYNLLSWQPQPFIGPQLWSDHFLLFFTINLSYFSKSIASWRLNESLLKNYSTCNAVRCVVSQFLSDHSHDMTVQPLKWKALQCVIRGTFISEETRLKKTFQGNYTAPAGSSYIRACPQTLTGGSFISTIRKEMQGSLSDT